MRLEQLTSYFAANQPDWRVVQDSGVLRAYVDVSSNMQHPIRESVDIDLLLGETPQELERLMLIRLNAILLAHVNDLVMRIA